MLGITFVLLLIFIDFNVLVHGSDIRMLVWLFRVTLERIPWKYIGMVQEK